LGKKHALVEMSAVAQNQPLKVEIKGFKTGYYLGVKTAGIYRRIFPFPDGVSCLSDQ